jgi:hypothetical protein
MVTDRTWVRSASLALGLALAACLAHDSIALVTVGAAPAAASPRRKMFVPMIGGPTPGALERPDANGPRPAAACPASLQSLIDAAAPGSVIQAPPCIYRETVTISKPLTLSGALGAEIRGSDVWTGWTRRGQYWIRSGAPAFKQEARPCRSGSDGRCNRPEQVFLDERPLRQVPSGPTSGQFAVDSAGDILLADDPTGHVAEVTIRERWIVGAADDVAIERFVMRHAAAPAQHGAIANDGHSGWTIQGSTLSDVHGAVVSLEGGHGLRLLDNDIARGGQLGVHASAVADVLVRGNKIHENNTEDFDPEWEAGALKAAGDVSRLTVDGNEVYGNGGPGIWCDIDCRSIVVSSNRVHDNALAGIFFEISDGASIHGNAVWENGWSKPSWGWGAGILISSSGHAEVYGNALGWNADGISVISQDRGDAPATAGIGNHVYGNTVASIADSTALGWFQDWNGPMYRQESDNQGADNAFWYPGAENDGSRFEWNSQAIARLAEFAATPGGHGSRYVASAERDQVLGAAGIPLAPKAR